MEKRDKSKDLALIGTIVAGKYRVLSLLGQGGFGSVFLVEVISGLVGTQLAMKVIPFDFTSDEKKKAMFRDEIAIAMKLVDKRIVQIRDFGEIESGQLYYTMDYFEGGKTLSAVLRRDGPLSPERAIRIAAGILKALRAAHAHGVIHRDLKPGNVMVLSAGGRETVQVLDFGLATAIYTERRGAGFVGTMHYMPPEQFLNQKLSYSTDTYSVGVILYECLTGQKPYQGRTPQEVYDALKSRSPVPPEEIRPELASHPALLQVVRRAMELDPRRRFPTVKDFMDDLTRVWSDLKTTLEKDGLPPLAPLAPEPEDPPPSPPAAPALQGAGLRRRPSRGPRIAGSRRPGSSPIIPVAIVVMAGIAVLFLMKSCGT